MFQLLMCAQAFGLPTNSAEEAKRIIRLTNAGWNVLGLTGDPNHARRHESIEHWYWKLTLAQKFHKEGCRVQVEKDGADIALEKEGKRIAVEIETGKSDSAANVRRNLEAGFDESLVVWISRVPRSASDRANVTHVLLRELLGDFTQA